MKKTNVCRNVRMMFRMRITSSLDHYECVHELDIVEMEFEVPSVRQGAWAALALSCWSCGLSLLS